MKTTIYFIRHAASPFIFGQEKERPLSNDGHQAAEIVAELLSKVQFDCFISSSYKRAIQTIEPLAKGEPIHTFDELREKQLKGVYKLPKDEIDEAIKNSFEDVSFKLEGGESTKEAQDRAVPIINRILNNPKLNTVAIGTHGNILTSILNHYDSSIGYEFWHKSSKPGIYVCEFEHLKLTLLKRIIVTGDK